MQSTYSKSERNLLTTLGDFAAGRVTIQCRVNVAVRDPAVGC
jgi:hypothetical protein